MRVKVGVYAALAIGACGTVNAGPVVLEETARIQPPAADIQLCCNVAVDGDSALVTGGRTLPENPDTFDLLALAFRRNASGVWTYERTLTQLRQDVFSPSLTPRVAAKNNVAATWLGSLSVFERSTSGWTAAAVQPDSALVQDLEIDAGTILGARGECSWSAQPWRKLNGTWSRYGFLPGSVGGCGVIFAEGDVDVSGNRAIVYSNIDDTGQHSEARIFDVGASLPWVQRATLTNPVSAGRRFGPHVAISGSTALVTGDIFDSVYVFDRNASGTWVYTGRIELPERIPGPAKVAMRNGFAFLSFMHIDHRGGVVAVLQRQSNGEFKYVARLNATDAIGESDLGGQFDVSGRRVVVSGDGAAAYVFDLPTTFTQPTTQEEDFQAGNANNWTQIPGSGFAVVTAGTSRYFRQSSTTGDARALLTTVDWQNQAIEADVTPTAFPGAAPGFERWAGLVARYQDANNFYYITLRSSNQLQLKRMLNGTFSTLSTFSLPVTLNRTYRLRLEAMGRSLKVYVDGLLVTFAADDSIPHGHVGLATYKAQANFDNILVTPNHYTRMFQTDFQQESNAYWSFPLGAWSYSGGAFVQTSLDGDARAITGPSVSDQVVQVKAQATQFASGGERWFGPIARYKDANNFYYVTLRNTNTVSLRKLVNGAITVIASASLPVTTGTNYDLRFSAIGSTLRVWVNGQLVLQGSDTSHVTGRFGLATYKTTARFDDLLTYQP